jgi:hypothetical protein
MPIGAGAADPPVAQPSTLTGKKSVRIATFLSSYLILGILVIIAIHKALSSPVSYTRTVPQGIASWGAVAVILCALVFVAFIIRRVNGRILYELLFGIALFLGVWVYCWDVIPWDIGLLVASLATILYASVRRVAIHDLYVLVGAAGIAIHFAFLFSDRIYAIVLVTFVFYDMVVGRAKGLAERMASSVIRRGAIPGLIIPAQFKGFWSLASAEIKDSGSVFLGAGDLILPLTLVARASLYGWKPAIAVIVGVLAGAWWLGSRRSAVSFPALVPLVTGGAIGLAASLLLKN